MTKNDLFLSHDELVDLTGFKAPHCQAKWLGRHRWRFVLSRHNTPKVARGHFNDRMGCGEGKGTSQAELVNYAAAGELPNYAALRRR